MRYLSSRWRADWAKKGRGRGQTVEVWGVDSVGGVFARCQNGRIGGSHGMGRRGPRPLSAAARQVRGSRSKVASGIPAAATGVPVMPDGLTGTEEAAWREIVALLEPRGVLTPCDAPMVELTAKTIVTMRQADAVIGREGSTARTASL